ncbi:unnamed protein product [Symbiodinium sp. CCMP2592]|nr:unnamed protein product [Symbiodinium sp. CCMP2592]
MGRSNRAPEESSSDSEQEWRLSGRRHLAEQHAATVTRTHEDFEGSTVAFTATSMVGLTPGQNLLLVPAAEVKKKTAEQAKAAAKAAAEKFVKERQESAQWAKEAEEAKKKRAAKAAEAKKKAAEAEKLINEATEAKKRAAEAVELVSDSPEGKKKKAAEAEKLVDEAMEAKKKAAEAEKLASKAAEAKKKAATEAVEAKKPKGSVARARAEPSSGSKDPPQPVVKRQPKPPMVKAMPAKVRKIVLKSRAQRGIPGQTDTALRMLSQRAKEKKKSGYLMKAINNAMKKNAEEQKGAPVRRTWEKHIKDHYAQIRGLEIPFVEVKVEGARAAKVPEVIKVEAMEINPPPPEPPAEGRAEQLHLGDDGKIYNSRGEVVELESIEIDRPQRDRSEESWGKLEREHVLRSHVPYNDRLQDSGMREVQIDKFFYKGLAFLVLVLVGAFALGVVPYREVSGSRGPAAKEAMLNDMSAWSRSVGLVGVAPSELTVSVKSDIEGVVKNLAQSFADGLTAGAIEVVDAPVGRHAVVAERAVRTIKEGANTLCAGLEQVGLEPCGKGVTYLLMHVAQVYNRYQVHPGSALSPEQRCLKTTRGPHAAYVWGAAVLATPPPSLRDKITGRYGHAAYLGPEVGSGSHIVQFRLRDGTLKIARSARIRMLVPLTFEVSSLKGVCRMLPGRKDDAQKKLPESSGENVRDLPRAILDQAPIEEEDLAEYEPSLSGVGNEIEVGEELERIEAPSPGELDFMQVEPEPLEALPEEERDAMVSSVMYRESISFAGASVCFAGAATTKVVIDHIARDPSYRDRLAASLWQHLEAADFFVSALDILPRAGVLSFETFWRDDLQWDDDHWCFVHHSSGAPKEDLNWVNVLTVSERDDGASTQTLLELKAIFAVQIKKKGFVFLWASTPCTGGCPYQRLRARDPAYRRGRTFKMSLVPFAAERAMVFGLVVEVQEKLLEVPSVGLLVVVLVPLLVGVALGVCLQKLRTESSRVKTVQDLLSFLPRSGQKMAVFTSAYGDCFHVRRDCHGLRNALPNRIAAKVVSA